MFILIHAVLVITCMVLFLNENFFCENVYPWKQFYLHHLHVDIWIKLACFGLTLHKLTTTTNCMRGLHTKYEKKWMEITYLLLVGCWVGIKALQVKSIHKCRVAVLTYKYLDVQYRRSSLRKVYLPIHFKGSHVCRERAKENAINISNKTGQQPVNSCLAACISISVYTQRARYDHPIRQKVPWENQWKKKPSSSGVSK